MSQEKEEFIASIIVDGIADKILRRGCKWTTKFQGLDWEEEMGASALREDLCIWTEATTGSWSLLTWLPVPTESLIITLPQHQEIYNIWHVVISVRRHRCTFKLTFNNFFVKLKENQTIFKTEDKLKSNFTANKLSCCFCSWGEVWPRGHIVTLFMCVYLCFVCFNTASVSACGAPVRSVTDVVALCVKGCRRAFH